MNADKNLGITQEYNSENRNKLWDSAKSKEEYKEKVFNGKKTYVNPENGYTLHKSQTAAQRKYHMKDKDGNNISIKWANYVAETDHIVSIKEVHDRVRYNPFLSDDDLKEIVNTPENYQLLSKHDNISKGKKSNWEIIRDSDNGLSSQEKLKMAQKTLKAEATLSYKFTARTIENIGNEALIGAKAGIVNNVIPLTVQAVDNMVQVVNREQSFDEAKKNMGKTVLTFAAAGSKERIIRDIAKNVPVLNSFLNNNTASQILQVANIVADSANRYLNGDIDGKEFLEEVGEKGTMLVAGMVGGEVGKEIGTIVGGIVGTVILPGAGTTVGVIAGQVIGEVLGTIITTVACSTIMAIYSTTKHLDDYKIKERQIKQLEAEALHEMNNQRMKFKSIVEREYHCWDEEIQNGFDQILSSACAETFNLRGVTNGLDRILAVFGKSVAFHDLEEYEAQLDQPLRLNF